jgi:hypothetical protein
MTENPKTLDHYLADINQRLLEAQDQDRELPPQLMQLILSELRKAATDETATVLSMWASQVLKRMWHRSVSGVPFGEPREWPYEMTLDELERTDR